MNTFEAHVHAVELGRPSALNGARQYLIIRDGRTDLSDGSYWLLDSEAAVDVVNRVQEHGVDLHFDYEHQSVGGKYTSPDGTAPAAGWIKGLRYQKGEGLYATVRWNEAAARMIAQREYRYMSPAVLVDKETRRIVRLRSVALTNTPAMAGCPELVAASRRNDWRLVMADEPQDTGQSAETLLVTVREILGLPEDATAEQVLQAAIEALRSMQAADSEAAKALGLKVDAGREALVAAIEKLKESTAPKSKLEEVVAANRRLGDQVKALTERSVKAEAKQLVAGHVQANKLTNEQAAIELELLTAKADEFEQHKTEFERRMAATPAKLPEPGKTVPSGSDAPRGREAVIAKAKAEYEGDESLHRASRTGYVNMALQDAGMRRLSEKETQENDLVEA